PWANPGAWSMSQPVPIPRTRSNTPATNLFDPMARFFEWYTAADDDHSSRRGAPIRLGGVAGYLSEKTKMALPAGKCSTSGQSAGYRPSTRDPRPLGTAMNCLPFTE